MGIDTEGQNEGDETVDNRHDSKLPVSQKGASGMAVLEGRIDNGRVGFPNPTNFNIKTFFQ